MRIADWLPSGSRRKVAPAEPRCSHMKFRIVSRTAMATKGDPRNQPETNIAYSGYDQVVEECLDCGRVERRLSLERPEESLAWEAEKWNRPADSAFIASMNQQYVSILERRERIRAQHPLYSDEQIDVQIANENMSAFLMPSQPLPRPEPSAPAEMADTSR